MAQQDLTAGPQGLTRTEAKRPVRAPPHFSAAIPIARCCSRTLSLTLGNDLLVTGSGGGVSARRRSKRLLTSPRKRRFSAARSFICITAGTLRPPKRLRQR